MPIAAIIAFLAQKALPWFLHQLARFWGVLVVALVIGIVLIGYKNFTTKIYERGYKAGYAQAIKDNPTHQYGSGTNVTNITDGQKTVMDIGIWRLRLGVYWSRH
jgi:hypothetical protein